MKNDLETLAGSFARELATLADLAHEGDGADCVAVSTEDLCNAMRQPNGAEIEEVRHFSLAVQRHLGPFGKTAACGCAHLALQVMARDAMARAVTENRDLKIVRFEEVAATATGKGLRSPSVVR